MHVLGTPHELEFYLKNVSPKFEDNKIIWDGESIDIYDGGENDE